MFSSICLHINNYAVNSECAKVPLTGRKCVPSPNKSKISKPCSPMKSPDQNYTHTYYYIFRICCPFYILLRKLPSL